MEDTNQSLQKDIGEKIKQLRTKKGLTMKELGENLNVSHAHISKLESGINSPSVDLLEKLSEFFNIDVSYFFAKKDEDDILFERDLSLEHLKDKYNLEIDGKPASDEEIGEMIKHIKLYRIMKQMEGS
jgi:transcriptional regulator with XRE-family HTH domain